MSQHKSLMNGSPVEKSQIHRLYPSLPLDGHDTLTVESPNREKRLTGAQFHPDRLQEDTQLNHSPPCSDVHLNAQILFLEEQRKQLLAINEKWAKEYKTMVRYYKEKVDVLKASQPKEEDKCDRKQITLQKKQQMKLLNDKENSQCGGSDVNADAEAEALRVQNITLTRRGQHQQAEIQRLNKALEEALQTSQSVGVSEETLQNIWKHQAAVYKEDFIRERKDREKLKGKYLDLEKKFRKLYDEHHLLKSQLTLVLKPQPAPHCSYDDQEKSPNRKACKVPESEIRLQRRHTLNAKQ